MNEKRFTMGRIKNLEPIRLQIEYETRLVKALTNITEGMSIREAAEEAGINPLNLNYLIYRSAGYTKNKLVNPDDAFIDDKTPIMLPLTPEEQLYCDIMGIKPESLKYLPDDLEQTMPIAIDLARLTDRERKLIEDIYWHGRHRTDIATELNLSRTCIESNISDAMKKLKRPRIKYVLKHGMAHYERCVAAKEQLYETNRNMTQALANELSAEVETFEKHGRLERLHELRGKIDEEILKETESIKEKLPLHKSGLPLTACQELAAYGIVTGYGLSKTPECIMKKLSPKTAAALTEYLEAHIIYLLPDSEINSLRHMTPETSVLDMGLSNRTVNALQRAGIKTKGQLEGTSIEELQNQRNIGKTILQDITETLAKINEETAIHTNLSQEA